jgi:hypothetical protein
VMIKYCPAWWLCQAVRAPGLNATFTAMMGFSLLRRTARRRPGRYTRNRPRIVGRVPLRVTHVLSEGEGGGESRARHNVDRRALPASDASALVAAARRSPRAASGASVRCRRAENEHRHRPKADSANQRKDRDAAFQFESLQMPQPLPTK